MNYTSSDAQDDAMRDSQSLTNWLAGECFHSADCSWRPSIDIVAWSPEDEGTDQLLAVAFDCGQPDKVRLTAIDTIRTRYLLSADGRTVVDHFIAKNEGHDE